MDFETVQNQVFSSLDGIDLNLEATIWRRFKIPASSTSDMLCIQSYNTTKGVLYIPNKKGYETVPIGVQMKVPHHLNSYAEKFFAYIPNKGIEHEHFFYLREETKGHWIPEIGEENIFFVYLEDRMKLVNGLYRISEYGREYHFYVGVVCMSFLLFFIGYCINGNQAFLTYSLYLLALVAYYGNRLLPLSNFYNSTIPDLYFYINLISRFGILFTYYYFIYVFLEVPIKFKKIAGYAKYSLAAIASFAVIYTLALLIYPLVPGRYAIINTFYVLAAINGLILVVSMFLSRPNKVAIVTLLGTILINVGSLISIYINDVAFLLKMVLVETVVFFGIISYQNKKKERDAAANVLALDIEKREKESLRQLDMLKSKLFANISHEFKTPLTLIQTPLEEAMRRREPLADNDFSLVYKNTNRLANLINNLLSLSKLESNTIQAKYKRGNPIKQLSDLCTQFKSYGQSKGITFTYEYDTDSITADYDHEILETCTNNLLSNAMKFTDKGGKVLLKATIVASSLQMVVSDSGIGIEIDEQDKIFDRFYQVSEKDETRPGSGIGLSIVKELVQLHKGSITVKSATGEGSTFTVTLPLQKIGQDGTEQQQRKKETVAISQNQIAPHHDIKSSSKKKQTILIVEDNADLLEFLARKLENSYNIKTSKNGKSGVEVALNTLPDVIISDVMMPKMNGIELCQKLKTHPSTSHIPIVLLTAKSEQKDELIGLGTGADAYVTKPFTLEKLELIIEQRIALRQVLLKRYKKNMLFEADVENITTAEQDFLQRLQRTLQNKLTDPAFNTEQMAETMGLSRMQLHRKIKHTINKTPSDLIRSERLILATTLLKDSKLSVKEVAYQSGFNSPSYFIKVFKRRFNMTPSDYFNAEKL
ncbi:MAG: ATP-binding protein [Bacteroidota bacterium]